MKLGKLSDKLPAWKSSLLAILAAVMLTLAFPDFEFWFLAWFALIPLLGAIEREKDSVVRSTVCGWFFGVVFFIGTSWWLTFAPITYAAFPPLLAYFLLLIVCMIVAVFPAVFAGIMAVLLRRFGPVAMLAVPFVWVFTEFARYWITGNNWNAIGYSQAFTAEIALASYGGVHLVALPIILFQSLLVAFLFGWPSFACNRDLERAANAVRADEDSGDAVSSEPDANKSVEAKVVLFFNLLLFGMIGIFFLLRAFASDFPLPTMSNGDIAATVVALQPNVPMSGLNRERWAELRARHVQLAEQELLRLRSDPATNNNRPVTVIFPESPMNFLYDEDPEFQAFIHSFARRNNVNVLFNSAEPNIADGKYFNSAVMVSPEGREVQQYDKIYLVPFGESVPAPLQSVVPAFVGSFSYGSEYDLFPLGDAQAGVMICFESHFGQLSREYVRSGADVLIEMTNDGYLGPTPILRQHLANAVFRAVETNRPVLRVTNVGITAYIDERGEVRNPAESYIEDTRVWSVAKSDGSQTLYVKYGDWFAWLCTLVTLVLLGNAIFRRGQQKV